MGCVASKPEAPGNISPAKVASEENSRSKSLRRQKSSRANSAAASSASGLMRAGSFSSRALTTHPSDVAAANIVSEAERESIHDVIKIMSTIGEDCSTDTVLQGGARRIASGILISMSFAGG